MTIPQRQGYSYKLPLFFSYLWVNYAGVLLIVCSTIGFSTLTILAKLAYANQLDALSTLSWRLGGGALVLWGWLFWQHQWKTPLRGAIAAFLIGALGYAVQSVCLFKALNYASAGISVVLLYTYPAFVTLINWATAQKTPNSWCIKALGLALIGCVLMVDTTGKVSSPLGLAFGIGSGIAYAIYMTLSARLVRNIPPLNAAAYMLSGATTTAALWANLHGSIALPSSPAAILAVLGLAILATAMPIGCLFAGLKRMEVVPAAILSTLEPVLAVLMGIGFLGERLWPLQVLGILLIVSSAIMLQLQPRRAS